LKIGCHISIQGGIQNSCARASSLNCESFQVFTQNQRQWISKSYSADTIHAFNKEKARYGFNNAILLSHASYLINLCANDPVNLDKSAHGGKGEEWAINTIAESINFILDCYQPSAGILLETVAGQGTSIGYKFEHLQKIIELIENSKHVGICLDTCHIFAAGYPIQNASGWNAVINEIEDTCGMSKLEAVHLNDCKLPCGSKRDRHAAIGDGFIGLDGFACITNMDRFEDIPGVLEVPGGEAVFRANIALLKSMRKNKT